MRCNISVSLGEINYAEGLSIRQMEDEEGLARRGGIEKWFWRVELGHYDAF